MIQVFCHFAVWLLNPFPQCGGHLNLTSSNSHTFLSYASYIKHNQNNIQEHNNWMEHCLRCVERREKDARMKWRKQPDGRKKTPTLMTPSQRLQLYIQVECGQPWPTSTTRVIEGRYKYQYVGKGMWNARVHSSMCHCSGIEHRIPSSENVKLVWTNKFPS